jgi:hypothetical protein
MATLGPPPPDATGATWARWINQLWDFVRPLQTTFTWDPANLADGAGVTSAAVTLTGAAFGDAVLVAAPYDLQGIVCTGYVSALNAVKVRLQNETGGAVDLANGEWRVRVLKSQ